ncbi:ammonium transporter [Sphaerisporangium siamense]|uniref:Ammonium transporter n=1 Tax=Sphaerisporangium siamense TaxID=795645 RepID=A0A7W7GA26_9ACTN|nr:ammonium transporter [Sphaerisporangium siamense]MBB4699536.1 Amt family ammonium transporter [Sphaerisporangium siamense]GII86950.1 ammonium transporter [Sphaerisporangium siamense]
MQSGLNTGDSAWMLVSTAMVLLMTPGLAFFYGGMVRSRNLLTMLYMSYICISLVTIVWFAYGYGLAFGRDLGGAGLIGWSNFLFSGISPGQGYGRIAAYIFAAFQATFSIITVALISGSIAGRARFGPWIAFVVLWVTFVYTPIAHWVFSPTGWINKWKVMDFAGGLVVELNSGIAGLALALVLGRGVAFRRREGPRPDNIPYVLLGLGLLWFGWFGFNAGSALTDGALASRAFVSTMIAGCAALLTWRLLEWIRFKRLTRLGSSSGALAGLVAITPSCAFVNVTGAFFIGVIAAIVCTYAVEMKLVLGYDDTLDVTGLHGVGGIVGVLALGFFATGELRGSPGLFHGGSVAVLGKQAAAVGAVGLYSFLMTYLIGTVVDRLFRMRMTDEEQEKGSDAHFAAG